MKSILAYKVNKISKESEKKMIKKIFSYKQLYIGVINWLIIILTMGYMLIFYGFIYDNININKKIKDILSIILFLLIIFTFICFISAVISTFQAIYYYIKKIETSKKVIISFIINVVYVVAYICLSIFAMQTIFRALMGI